ncbi:hypothetical protein DDQ68_11565 [Hymenobacter nivis]|uniref:Uncharacterized protein n=1 Tax=Hymenobacter nivis TaxID=1850093 RepID=A0A2Z3GQR1_9BACT|nr:hypothetical protein DDQ68_11565 [Hymenobacter nivis]
MSFIILNSPNNSSISADQVCSVGLETSAIGRRGPICEALASQQLTQPTLTNTGADEYLPYRRESEDHETVSGLLSVVYGSTPEVGDMAVLDPYEFRVLAPR